MRKTLSILLSMILIFTCSTAVFAYDDGELPMGKIINGTGMIPLRGAFEELGFDVTWDSATSSATLDYYNHTIVVTKDDPNFTVDGVVYTSEVPPQIVDGTMYIPLRALGDKIGATTIWDEDTRVASISFDGSITYIILTEAEQIPASNSIDEFYMVDDILTIEDMMGEIFITASTYLEDTDASIAVLEELKLDCIALRDIEDPYLTPVINRNVDAYANNMYKACDEIIIGLTLYNNGDMTAFEHFDKAIRYAYITDLYNFELIDHYNSFLE